LLKKTIESSIVAAPFEAVEIPVPIGFLVTVDQLIAAVAAPTPIAAPSKNRKSPDAAASLQAKSEFLTARDG